jgi:hypothetical protein
MKITLRKLVTLLLCLGLCMLLIPAAFAEETVRAYDDSVITGFEDLGSAATVNTEYYYAMIELQKEFPAQLTVYTGGVVRYEQDENGTYSVYMVEDAVPQSIGVTWRCLENYNDNLESFHFVPALDGYELAEGVELPVITVNVLGQLEIPPMNSLPEAEHPTVPILGSVSTIRRNDLPTSYDARSFLPPVRNQNPYGTCLGPRNDCRNGSGSDS